MTTKTYTPMNLKYGGHFYVGAKFYDFHFASMGQAEEWVLNAIKNPDVKDAKVYYEDECGKHFYTPSHFSEA